VTILLLETRTKVLIRCWWQRDPNSYCPRLNFSSTAKNL